MEHAEERFLGALAGVTDPERKRHIIGEEFVRVQERVIESRSLLDEHWILGQGTIYPDTIESGGTAKAAVIKTHHNRVAGIQKLIQSGRIVEPLKSFYKDEVREVGRELGLPPSCWTAIRSPAPAWRSAVCARNRTRRCGPRRRASSSRCIRWACRAIPAATRRCWRSIRWTTRAPPP